MIIFGTRGMNSRVSSGMFTCPRCAMQRPYTHKAVRTWFTLYFIPVIPMGRRGEFIECNACGGTFGVEVLNYNPQAQRAAGMATLRRIAVLALGEAGRLQPPNVSALCQAIGAIGETPCTEAEVHEDWSQALKAQAQVLPFARSKVTELNESGRVLAMKLAIHALRAGAPLDGLCMTVLGQLAEGLEVGPNAMEQLLSDEQKLLP